MHSKNKHITILGQYLLATTFVLTTAGTANAALECLLETGCDKKICELEREIESARDHGNQGKAIRLQEELARFRPTCTNGRESGSAAHEFLKTQGKVKKFSTEIPGIVEKFVSKAIKESQSLEPVDAYEEAMVDIEENLQEALEDLRDARLNLEEDMNEMHDETASLATPSASTTSAARELAHEIANARDMMTGAQTTFQQAVSEITKLAKKVQETAEYQKTLRSGLQDIEDELRRQSAVLHKEERFLQTVAAQSQ